MCLHIRWQTHGEPWPLSSIIDTWAIIWSLKRYTLHQVWASRVVEVAVVAVVDWKFYVEVGEVQRAVIAFPKESERTTSKPAIRALNLTGKFSVLHFMFWYNRSVHPMSPLCVTCTKNIYRQHKHTGCLLPGSWIAGQQTDPDCEKSFYKLSPWRCTVAQACIYKGGGRDVSACTAAWAGWGLLFPVWCTYPVRPWNWFWHRE